MKIYLIRHGETTGDVEGRYGGDYDDRLTEKGRQQSKELAGKIKGRGIEMIYHSPRIRAAETAGIVAQEMGLEMQAVPDLRERNHYGVLTGLTRQEAIDRHPKEVEELSRDNLRHMVKGSEEYSRFKERVAKAFNHVTGSDKYSIIAVIIHGGPINCIFREVLRLGDLNDLGDCAILEIEKIDDGYKIINMDGAEMEGEGWKR